MADVDDFEIINETSLSNEQTFELIDVNDMTEKNKPPTLDPVLPLFIPKPLVEETSPIVQQQTSTLIINTPEPVESHLPIKTTVSTTSFVPIKQTIPSSSPPPSTRIFAAVPPLPKAPPLRRYGDAALIPHNLDKSFDIDTVIDKSKQNQQITLKISQQQQQHDDIRTALEQRRKLLNKN